MNKEGVDTPNPQTTSPVYRKFMPQNTVRLLKRKVILLEWIMLSYNILWLNQTL